MTATSVIVSQDRSSALGSAAVIALSRVDGRQLWSYDTGLTAAGPPALAADGGIFVVVGRTLLALGPDGTLRWRRVGFYAGAPIIGGDGTVYAGGQPLTALRPSDGAILWRLPARSRAYPESIGADGTLYIDMFLGLKLALAPSRRARHGDPRTTPPAADLPVATRRPRDARPRRAIAVPDGSRLLPTTRAAEHQHLLPPVASGSGDVQRAAGGIDAGAAPAVVPAPVDRVPAVDQHHARSGRDLLARPRLPSGGARHLQSQRTRGGGPCPRHNFPRDLSRRPHRPYDEDSTRGRLTPVARWKLDHVVCPKV